MKTYHLIYLRSNKMLLSSIPYADWREIQEAYTDYMSSLEFDTPEAVAEFLRDEYNLTLEAATQKTAQLSVAAGDTIEIIL